jgi:hypothetical protein
LYQTSSSSSSSSFFFFFFFFLFLKTVSAVHNITVYRRSESVAPLILNLDARCRKVVNNTTHPLYPRGITPLPIE